MSGELKAVLAGSVLTDVAVKIAVILESHPARKKTDIRSWVVSALSFYESTWEQRVLGTLSIKLVASLAADEKKMHFWIARNLILFKCMKSALQILNHELLYV